MSDTDTTADGRDAVRRRHREAHSDALDGVTVAPWIGGESARWTGGESGDADGAGSVATRDPVTDEPIVAVPVCDAAAVDRAVATAWDAYDREWADTTPAERSRRLFEWTDELRANVENLALLESLDTGKPMGDARGEVEGAIDTLEYYASVVRAQTGEQVPAGEALHMYTRTEPFGVWGGSRPGTSRCGPPPGNSVPPSPPATVRC